MMREWIKIMISDPDLLQKRLRVWVIVEITIIGMTALYFDYVSLGVAWVVLLYIYGALMLVRSSND